MSLWFEKLIFLFFVPMKNHASICFTIFRKRSFPNVKYRIFNQKSDIEISHHSKKKIKTAWFYSKMTQRYFVNAYAKEYYHIQFLTQVFLLWTFSFFIETPKKSSEYRLQAVNITKPSFHWWKRGYSTLARSICKITISDYICWDYQWNYLIVYKCKTAKKKLCTFRCVKIEMA